MEPRRRRMRATYPQLKLLVKFMSDNPSLARGVNHRTAFGKHYHDAKWMELADLLNAQQHGMNKSPREWNRYWKDLKSGIKKKVQSMKKMKGNSKKFLSSIEQIIYRDMCVNRQRKNSVTEEKDCSYLQIPTDSDHEQNKYEVEYLEDSGDESQMTNLTDLGPAVNFETLVNEATRDDIKSKLRDRNVRTLNLLEQDSFLIDTLLNESNSTTEPKTETFESRTVMNDSTNIKSRDNNVSTSTNDDKNDILIDIRNHLKELVAVQKDRARSELRLASAHERRAILEEKKVRIEERRLKIEERRVALEERKMEALEKRSFAQERLASAVERRNEITEIGMTNSEFVLKTASTDHF